MNQELITHIYSSLHGLEKCVEESREMIRTKEQVAPELTQTLGEQERVITHMRRIANLLQLEVAKSNIPEATRLLNIYYSLNQMVRPEVIATYSALANNKLDVPTTGTSADTVVH